MGKSAAARAALPNLTSVCNIFACPNAGMAAIVWENNVSIVRSVLLHVHRDRTDY